MPKNSTEKSPPTQRKGRPPKTGPKTDLQFHLVMIPEEWALFRDAAHAEGITSIAAFLRGAVRSYNSRSRKNRELLELLLPDPSDKPKGRLTKHYPLLLSEEIRGLIVQAEDMGVFIRKAGITRALELPRTPEIEEDLKALSIAKGR